jgi:hypothetical protein
VRATPTGRNCSEMSVHFARNFGNHVNNSNFAQEALQSEYYLNRYAYAICMIMNHEVEDTTTKVKIETNRERFNNQAKAKAKQTQVMFMDGQSRGSLIIVNILADCLKKTAKS